MPALYSEKLGSKTGVRSGILLICSLLAIKHPCNGVLELTHEAEVFL